MALAMCLANSSALRMLFARSMFDKPFVDAIWCCRSKALRRSSVLPPLSHAIASALFRNAVLVC
eukprot:1840308-Rhodomonas_salina.2